MNLKKSNSFTVGEKVTEEVEEIQKNGIKRSVSFKIPKWNIKKNNSFTVVEDKNQSEEIQNNTIKRTVSFKVPKWKETKEVQSTVPRTNSFWPKSTRQRLFLPYFAIPCLQHSNEIQISSMIRYISNKKSKSRLLKDHHSGIVP